MKREILEKAALGRICRNAQVKYMKRIYRKLLRAAELLPVKLETAKTQAAEWYSIFRKAPLYRHIKWSKEQQQEFDLFWKTNYGKTISNRWHRLYEASNGVHRVDYFPEYLYSTKLEPKLNDYCCTKVFANKNLLSLFFDGKVDNVRTPKTYLACDHGTFFDEDRRLISRDRALELLKNIGEAVIKPTVDSSSGKNIVIVCMQNGTDSRSGCSAEALLLQYGRNFTVQERLKPCDTLRALYPHSINTIRVVSYQTASHIGIAPVSLRIGGGGSEVDNIHAGGMSVAVSKTGQLFKTAYRLGYGDSFQSFTCHPDTGTVFDGYQLPFLPQVLDAAKRLHEKTSGLGIISWDFTVNSEEQIIVVEANCRGQSAWFPQMLSGEALFGEDTAKILKTFR